MRKPSNYTRHLVGLILALAGLLSGATLMLEPAGGASGQAPGPSWGPTCSLNVGRSGHTATLLPNGQVLVAGGCSPPSQIPFCQALSSAELYDPATGTWRATGALNSIRSGHT